MVAVARAVADPVEGETLAMAAARNNNIVRT
jgi:hypothetical protein